PAWSAQEHDNRSLPRPPATIGPRHCLAPRNAPDASVGVVDGHESVTPRLDVLRTLIACIADPRVDLHSSRPLAGERPIAWGLGTGLYTSRSRARPRRAKKKRKSVAWFDPEFRTANRSGNVWQCDSMALVTPPSA